MGHCTAWKACQCSGWGTNIIRAGGAALTAGSNVSSVVALTLQAPQSSLVWGALQNFDGASCGLLPSGPQACRVSSHSSRLPALHSQGRSGAKLESQVKVVWPQELLRSLGMCLEVVSVDCGEIPLVNGAFGCWFYFFAGKHLKPVFAVCTALVALDVGPLICHFCVLFFKGFYPRALITIFGRCFEAS